MSCDHTYVPSNICASSQDAPTSPRCPRRDARIQEKTPPRLISSCLGRTVELGRRALASMARPEHGHPHRLLLHPRQRRTARPVRARPSRAGMSASFAPAPTSSTGAARVQKGEHPQLTGGPPCLRITGTILAILQLCLRPLHVPDHGQHRRQAGTAHRHV